MPSIPLFSTPGTFWRGNLHTHSHLSDGGLPPADVVSAYRDAGYDFMALTDHFLERYDWPIADTRALRNDGFTTLIGAEIHAPKTNVGELWHLVTVGLPLDFPPCRATEDGPALARRARDAGAFVAIAHPAWSQLDLEDGLSIDTAHAVEIYNHGCAVENDRGDGLYLLDQLLNTGRRLTAVATDDAHFRSFDRDAFGGWVHVKAEENTPDALLDALKAGHMYSSEGPQIHDIAIDGNRLSIASSPVDTVSVIGGNSRTAVAQGRHMTSAELDLGQLGEGWLLERESAWFRCVAIDAAGRRAWTNPIWQADL
ncbi:MAG: CehA/McbA family metallohydrolase [Pseudomonadota bacterium]